MAVGPYGALLEAVRGVRWPARRAVAGGAPGAHLARSRGVATEFAEYRPYRQGDDPRRVDWKLLARSDRTFVRLAPDRAVLPTLVVVDASASMDFPGGRDGKWPAARRIAVGTAAVVHASGDPVGVAIAAVPGAVRLPPRTRRGVVAEIARTLDAVSPGGNAPLAELLAGAPARVLVITDCLGDLGALHAAARGHVASGGDAHLVHVVARAELDPPRGATFATDPEDPSVRRPLTDETRAAYLDAFAAWRADTARAWRDDGVAYHVAMDDEPAEMVVRRVVVLPGGGARA
ncbi:MAG: DUF58 domain-containing protein [Gemmatimonadetes bacterium]|nr:DUF58 domain-containing protein [Gemmatimonadota bacterium]